MIQEGKKINLDLSFLILPREETMNEFGNQGIQN